jgi:hypothetical protein
MAHTRALDILADREIRSELSEFIAAIIAI